MHPDDSTNSGRRRTRQPASARGATAIGTGLDLSAGTSSAPAAPSPGAGGVDSAAETQKRKALIADLTLFRDMAAETVEGMPLGFVALDHAMCATYANPMALTLTGASLDALVGRRPWDLFPEIVGTQHQTFRTSAPIAIEYEAHFAPSDLWAAVLACPTQTGISIFLRDISGQKRAEETVRSSVALLHGSLDAMLDACMVCSAERDHQGAIVSFRVDFTNVVAGMYLGSPPDKLIGAPIPDWKINPRDMPFLDACRRVVETGDPLSVDALAYAIAGPEGTSTPGALSLQVARFSDGFFATWRDVTETQRVATERERLAVIVDQVADGIVAVDAELRITYANAAFAGHAGRAPLELVGERVLEVIDGTLDAPTIAKLREVTRSGQPWLGEAERRLADGTVGLVQIRLTPRRAADGTLEGYVAVSRDVTQLRGAERAARETYEALRRSEERYRELVEQSTDGILVSDASGRYVEANPALCRMLGYSRDELLGMQAGDLTAADDPVGNAGMDAKLGEATGEAGLLIERRYRRRDATSLPVEVAFRVLADGSQQRSVRDITERKRLEAERARLAAATEQSLDGVVILDADLRIAHANPVFAAAMGRTPAELVGRSAVEVMSIGVDETTVADAIRSVGAGQSWSGEVDHRNPDGTTARFETSISPLREADGRISGWVGIQRDVTERQRAERDMRRLSTAIEQSEDGILIADVGMRITYANAAFAADVGQEASELVGRALFEVADQALGRPTSMELATIAASAQPWLGEIDRLLADGSVGRLQVRFTPRLMADGTIEDFVVGFRDVTELRRGEAERVRLSAAIEQSADAVVITDADANIEYVNPAFEKVSGYTREEALAQNPRILNSGVQDRAFYAAMWTALTNGRSFAGDLTNRRKDGSLYQVQAVISPVRDADGKTTSYVAVSHDVTRERALEAAAVRQAREHAEIAEALSDMKTGLTPEATAEAICQRVVMLADANTAALWRFSIEGPAVPLAIVRMDGTAVPLRPLPARRSDYLHERAAGGPWVEAWLHRPWHPYDHLFRELGVRAASYAPVRHGGDLVGLLIITSADEDAISGLTESLPALLEFAAVAGVLVGPAIIGLTQAGNVRNRIMKIIGEDRFHPVFQPIVDLGSRMAVGYEALTRFDSGQRPDLCFADAWSVELGPALELATLGKAVAAARTLPAGRWLSLNVSPRLLLETERLKAVVWPSERPIVLEITEHEIIEDYGAVAAALRALGHDVRLAVDDAGAGIANLSHIVELRPNLVKLDIGLVRDVNTDLGRQAMVVAMSHFSRETGCRLLAEGVETEAEAGTLSQLAVDLGQGYLFGHPEPAEVWARAGAAAPERSQLELPQGPDGPSTKGAG